MSVAILSDDQINRCEHVFSEPGFGALSTSKGNLPLESLDVHAAISGLFARTTLKQTFVNNLDQPIEATYIFPLPDRGAVHGFRMYVGDRVIEGIIKERGEARRDYDRAISQGHRASIVEEERPDTFTMRVGNIAPGEKATIELELIVPLIFSGGEATFRFPLVVAPRYIPGSPREGASVGDGTASDTTAVPDASRISPPVFLPGFKSAVRLGIEVSLDHSGLAKDAEISSSLHAITSVSNDRKTLIKIQPEEKINRDFILRFKVAEEKIRSSFLVIPDEKGDSATFLLTMVPPSKAADQRRPRDIVFVLDRSGSMGGWKMVAARRAVGRMIDTLNAEDSFQVLAFDDSIERPKNMTEGLIEATNRNRYRAIEWLGECDARGGTEMAQPLYQALSLLEGRAAGRDRHVVLVTDGQVGNEDQIVKGVHDRMKGAHVFTVGIDQAVNGGFLNRLAEISGGRCELVESEDRLDAVMDKVHRMIDTPVLNEVTVRIEGAMLIPTTMTPDHPVSLFAAAPLTLSGRLTGKGDVSARVRGTTPGQVLFEEVIQPEIRKDSAFAAVWARAKIRSLEDQYAAVHNNRHLVEKQITEISLRYKVLCRFTSFVAVDEAETVEGDLQKVMQPVESPEGWASMGGAPMSQSAPMPSPSMAAPMSPSSSMKKRSAPLGRAQAASAPMQAKKLELSKETSVSMEFMDDMDDMDMEESADLGYDSFAAQRMEAPMEAPAPPPADMLREIAAHSKGRGRRVSHTQSGVMKTQLYQQSPEQVLGRHLSAAHDVFCLALLWVELLLGRPLFQGGSDFEILEAIRDWDVSKMPSELARWKPVLAKALAADPRDRYQSAGEFAIAIVELAEALGVEPEELTCTPSASRPATFGAYALEQRLAVGTGYELRTALRNGAHRIMKIYDTSISADDDFVDALFEEVRIDAPHVLSLAEFGEEEGRTYMAYDGEAVASLAAVKASEGGAFKAILEASMALEPLHSCGAVHGDIIAREFVVLADGSVAMVGLGHSSNEVTQSVELPDSVEAWLAPKQRTAFWK